MIFKAFFNPRWQTEWFIPSLAPKGIDPIGTIQVISHKNSSQSKTYLEFETTWC